MGEGAREKKEQKYIQHYIYLFIFRARACMFFLYFSRVPNSRAKRSGRGLQSSFVKQFSKSRRHRAATFRMKYIEHNLHKSLYRLRRGSFLPFPPRLLSFLCEMINIFR